MIAFYGADWCGDCRRSKALLDRLQVAYDYLEVDKDASLAAKVVELNGGAQSIPVLVFEDGTQLTEPSNADLLAKLADLGLVAAEKAH